MGTREGEVIGKDSLNVQNAYTYAFSSDYQLSADKKNVKTYLYIAGYSFTMAFHATYAFFGTAKYTISLQCWDGQAWVTQRTINTSGTGNHWFFVNSVETSGNVVRAPCCKWRFGIHSTSGDWKRALKGNLYMMGPGFDPMFDDSIADMDILICHNAVQGAPFVSGTQTDAVPSDGLVSGIFDFARSAGSPILADTAEWRFVF